jgi:hypothetical protein
MKYYINWEGTRVEVGDVQYYSESIAIPKFQSECKITTKDDKEITLILIGMIEVSKLHRYFVLYEGFTHECTSAYYIYDSDVVGRFKEVDLTRLNCAKHDAYLRFLNKVKYVTRQANIK